MNLSERNEKAATPFAVIKNKKTDFRPSNEGRILQVFLNTSMANSHKGLKKIAAEHKIDAERLLPEHYLIFINRTRTMVKVLTANNVMAFYRSPRGPVTLHAIRHIPKAFMSPEGFEMAKAIEMALIEILGEREEYVQ